MTSQSNTETPVRTTTLAQALNSYRDAVARRAYWEDHGHRRDGNLEEARVAEAAARRVVVRIATLGHDA
jgi:hypothetical protein